MSKQDAKSYKDTIILPQTDFPMKANLANREPEQMARWAEQDIYARIREARAGAPKFVLHDGPPYATGDLHVGTGLNKVLKDFVVRYKTMRGFDSPYRPGWDCHGLPIEHRVGKELGPKIRQMPVPEIRERCLDYAMKFFNRNREDFQRLLIFGQWDDPYLTVDHEYEAGVLDLFAEMVEKGYVYRALRPIHWCIRCETALAEAELDYDDITSPSIYVRFPLVGDAGEAFGDADSSGADLLIWTTTPWTLPANLAIAVHPSFDYVLVEADDRDGKRVKMILAAGLVEAVAEAAGLTNVAELARCKGGDLEGLKYRHVFMDRESPVVLADYVTLEDGTGCVHTAPGHGREDFMTGQKYGLDALSPVDNAGRFTEAGGPFAGQQVFEADPNVVARLRDDGVLLHHHDYGHSYPHCWRCKRPVIFRSTEQWFVNVEHEDLRRRLLGEIDKVRWVPDWGRARIESMVENRPDWCISRQRAWGVPIPAFYNRETGQAVIDADLVRHVRDLFAEHGTDYWFTHETADLLPAGYPDADKLEKENDIFDVWFESGASHWSVCRPDEQLGWPVDLYLEGSDQHRGWFQVSMITAMCARDDAPYEAVLTHGFVVDEDGSKMSKSAGNFISVADATKAVGADIFRLWVSSTNFRDDIHTSIDLMNKVGESYRRVRNTLRFLLGNLHDFDPAEHSVAADAMLPMDRWAMMRVEKLTADVCAFYDDYVFHRVFSELYTFCDSTLSSFYLDALKDRLYCDGRNSVSRRSAQTAAYACLRRIVQLLAPLCPFTAEEAYQAMGHKWADADSVHLLTIDAVDASWQDAVIDEQFTQLFAVRDDVLNQLEALRKDKKIGGGLDARITLAGADEKMQAFLAEQHDLLAPFFNVSLVELADAPGEGFAPGEAEPRVHIKAEPSDAEKCGRCWKRLPTVGQDAAHPTLCDRCAEVVKAQ